MAVRPVPPKITGRALPSESEESLALPADKAPLMFAEEAERLPITLIPVEKKFTEFVPFIETLKDVSATL